MTQYLDFEKPLAEIEGKAEELRALARANEEMDIESEAKALDLKAGQLLEGLYKNLTAWRKCQVARHPERPHCKDYIKALFTEFTPLAGDRSFADDLAVMGGLARFNDQPVMVIGHEKGSDTKSRIERNFGMARPEGYRKAIRLMQMADKFNLPVITLVDTPGAYPGKGAEERGQSEAIARSTEACLQIGVPLVSIIIGIPLGIISAYYHRRLPDTVILTTTLVGYSLPVFWWALLIIFTFSLHFGWFPSSGRIGLVYEVPHISGFILVDFLRSDIIYKYEALRNALMHMALPTLVLTTYPTTVLIRYTRGSMLNVLETNYIKTARAKGLSPFQVLLHHGLRNALLPVIRLIGLQFSSLITLAMITEVIFSWPGGRGRLWR